MDIQYFFPLVKCFSQSPSLQNISFFYPSFIPLWTQVKAHICKTKFQFLIHWHQCVQNNMACLLSRQIFFPYFSTATSPMTLLLYKKICHYWLLPHHLPLSLRSNRNLVNSNKHINTVSTKNIQFQNLNQWNKYTHFWRCLSTGVFKHPAVMFSLWLGLHALFLLEFLFLLLLETGVDKWCWISNMGFIFTLMPTPESQLSDDDAGILSICWRF